MKILNPQLHVCILTTAINTSSVQRAISMFRDVEVITAMIPRHYDVMPPTKTVNIFVSSVLSQHITCTNNILTMRILNSKHNSASLLTTFIQNFKNNRGSNLAIYFCPPSFLSEFCFHLCLATNDHKVHEQCGRRFISIRCQKECMECKW